MTGFSAAPLKQSDVLYFVAGAAVGAIGTYAQVSHQTTNNDLTTGGVFAGSVLRYHGSSAATSTISNCQGSALGSALSGSWLICGYSNPSSSSNTRGHTIAKRIA